MATVSVSPPGFPGPNFVSLSAEQTGDGQSTNVADRGNSVGPALLTITTTVGATPTCTYAVEGSADGSDWFNVAFADAATPETLSVATFAITTATTVRKILRPNHPWRFLRITFTANTNVTSTATLHVF